MLLQLAFQLTGACQHNACEYDVDDVYASLSPHSSPEIVLDYACSRVICHQRFTKSVTGM